MDKIKLSLKVDVDTYDGMRIGVPDFLKLFKEFNIKASFFIPFGPDESGKAVFRIFRKKGFLKKMFRTNAAKLYGIKTMLRGTLLPAPLIGSSFPEIVQSVIKEGHELGIHGYNHVLWQDHLLEMNEKEIQEQFESGMSSYEKVTGAKPKSFAAPAWYCSPLSLKIMDEFHFDYASDTRGQIPFYPSMNGKEFKTLQIPSTLPTLDELLGANHLNEQNVHPYLTKLMESSNLEYHVHTIHTEAEGMAFFDSFSKWIKELRENRCEFLTLSDSLKPILSSGKKIQKNEIILKEIPGRAGKVACQKLDS